MNKSNIRHLIFAWLSAAVIELLLIGIFLTCAVSFGTTVVPKASRISGGLAAMVQECS